MYGGNKLEAAVNAYLTSAAKSKGSEVIPNLNRIMMVLNDKVESLESANVILTVSLSLYLLHSISFSLSFSLFPSMDKALSEKQRQGSKMQEEWKK